MPIHVRAIAIWLFICCLFTGSVFSQADTSRHVRQPAAAGLFAESNELTTSDYALSIEKVYETLNTVDAGAALGLDVKIIMQKLAENDSAISLVKENLTGYSSGLNLKNLQMYEILLADLKKELIKWKVTLEKYDTKISGLQQRMRAVRKDTVLMHLIKDSVARKPFMPQLLGLRKKWTDADSTTKANLAVINNLLTHISGNSIAAAELSNLANSRLEQISAVAFSKEINYLWEANPREKVGKEIKAALRKSYRGEQKAVGYYFSNSGGSRLLMLLAGILFCWWVFANFRAIKKTGNPEKLAQLDLKYIKPFSILATLVVMFCIAPILDLNPPAAYIEMMQFLLMVTLTALFWRQWPRRLFVYWCVIVLLYILFALTQRIVSPDLAQRLWVLTLNGVSVVFGLFFLLRIRKALSMPDFVRIVTIIYIILNVLAIICNIYGRFTLARIFGSAAIFGLSQIIGLAVFIQIIIEATLLQVQRSRWANGVTTPFNGENVTAKSRKILTFIALVIWVMVFTTNLNIYSPLYGFFSGLLSTKREIGNITFTIGNVALFFIIIGIANLVQQYVSYFFGEVDDDDFTTENKGQRSRLMITRLVVLALGFLLAVAASGLPIDKITIVLGALGVGIGLGLQNIVNNFVSGVVLIFEQPMQLGDTIEVGGKTGRVKEIGIRSSKLLTPDGAEIIVPNGDLVSQQFVNWTLSNNYVRLELALKIASVENTETLKVLIIKAIKESPMVLPHKEPAVVFETIGTKEVALKAFFWCGDINKADEVRSEVLVNIKKELKENNVELE